MIFLELIGFEPGPAIMRAVSLTHASVLIFYVLKRFFLRI